MKYDIFISYSRADFDEVNGLVEMLKRQIPSLSVWFDITGIESGDEFDEKIISAIDQSSYVIFALSDNSINSKWAKDEVMYAKNTDKKVVPVLLRGAQLKGWFLFNFGRVDCIDSTIPLQVDKLIRNLSTWTNKPASNEPQEQFAQPEQPAQPSHTEPVAQPTPEPAVKTYKVGDYYDDGTKQGVVFDVWDEGRHGKIVSLDEGKVGWAVSENYGTFFDKLIPCDMQVGCNDTSNGMVNTRKIQQIDNWKEKYPAFAWCAKKGESWYLPAIEELYLLLLDANVHYAVDLTLEKEKGELLGFLGQEHRYYSSSTEFNGDIVWCIYMRDEKSELSHKCPPMCIRAVARF